MTVLNRMGKQKKESVNFKVSTKESGETKRQKPVGS